jgi:peroxiredoxin
MNTAEQSDPMQKARGFRDQHRLTYPILVDASGKAREALQVVAFPTNIVIDASGIVRYYEPGFNQGAIDRALRELKTKPAK